MSKNLEAILDEALFMVLKVGTGPLPKKPVDPTILEEYAKLYIPKEPNLDKFLIETIFRGDKATCKDCGETFSRAMGGDLDDWAYYDFCMMCEKHERECSCNSLDNREMNDKIHS